MCYLFIALMALSSYTRGAVIEGTGSLELLSQLVKINSHSQNISGISEIRKILIPEFQKLGFTARHYDLDNQHIITSIDFPGQNPIVLLIGHLDTVFPASAKVGKEGTEENRIYGPGIIDMKGGVVVILKALEKLSLEERKKIRIVLNDDEELASVYSREKLKEIAKNIPFGLVFEPGLPDGSLVTSSSGGRWIKLTIEGKAAHAGLEHMKGLNACAELAHQITRLHALTDYSKRLTLNIGTIEGGTEPNVVCEKASVKLDVRYVNPSDLDDLLKKIEQISLHPHVRNNQLGLVPICKQETLVVVPSMPESSTRTLFALAQEVSEKLGKKVRGEHVGYATDGNQLVEIGTQLLVGLGPYGGGMHTDQEFMNREALDERITLSTHLIRKILSRDVSLNTSQGNFNVLKGESIPSADVGVLPSSLTLSANRL